MTKKILQISPYWFDHPGGVEQYAKILQNIFPKKIVTFAWWIDFPIVEPVKHFPLPKFWKWWFFQVFREMKKENTEAIISHIRFAPTAWLAFFLAKKRWIPYIHIEHWTGFLIHKNWCISLVSKIVDLTIGRYIIRKSDQVICISEAWKEWVSEIFWRKKDSIGVIYRWFEFPIIERKINLIPKIGFVWRLTWLKNIDTLLIALSEIKSKNWNLEIVGDGEERWFLEKLTKELWIQDIVKFLWSKPHDWIIQEFYPSIDIFINPSLQEWLPTTVIEAIWMGCQVIATDVWWTREISRDILIKSWDKEELKEEIMIKLQWDTTKIEINQFEIEKMKLWYSDIFEKKIEKPKKIYFLINSLEWGGAERVISHIANNLIENIDIDLITLKSSNSSYHLDKRIRIIPLTQIKKFNILLFLLIPYFIIRLKKILKKENYMNGISFLEISNFIHILTKKDAIISFRTSIWFFQGFFGSIYKYCIKKLYPKAKNIIVNSKENQYKLNEFLEWDISKIIVIYNPIDQENAMKLANEKLPNNIVECCNNKTIFITTWRLIPSKNQETIIKSLVHFSEDWILLVLGDGPNRKHLEEISIWLNIQDKIKFLGFQENIFPYIQLADYFIYASLVEWFPNAILEAITLWKPIITSDFETWARECIFGTYTNKKINYPKVWKYGVLFSKENFEEDFIDFLPLLHTLSEQVTENPINQHFNQSIDNWKKILKI